MATRTTSWAGLLLMLLAFVGCASSRHYSSLDLGLLPCEMGPPVFGAPEPFFHPLEFTAEGKPAFPEQVEYLKSRLSQPSPRLYDLVFFVHGWNKSPFSAEADYQNFLCRLHARLRVVIADEKAHDGLVVVGIFWPSTIANSDRESPILTPWSYYRMRNRADRIAEGGLAALFAELIPILQKLKPTEMPLPQLGENNLPISQRPYRGARLQLIGHSFGGRMLVRSLATLSKRDKLVPFLLASASANVVLLNAAVPAANFDWIASAIRANISSGTPARLTEATSSYLFNIHSFNDGANRVLFPLASTFDDDAVGCAAGACGVPDYATICIDDHGSIRETGLLNPAAASNPTARVNVWNVDATEIVFSHTDIYKGRVAHLLPDLIYGPLRSRFPANRSGLASPAERCTQK